MDRSTPGLPVHHQLLESAQTQVHRVGDASQPSHPPCPLLLPSSIFPSIRVFSSESALHIRWLKYWSFSFSISPFGEHSGPISSRMDWLDLLAVPGALRSLSWNMFLFNEGHRAAALPKCSFALGSCVCRQMCQLGGNSCSLSIKLTSPAPFCPGNLEPWFSCWVPWSPGH